MNTAIPVSGTFYQATQPVSIASGQVASGAFASGSIASGAIASGAIASGYRSGRSRGWSICRRISVCSQRERFHFPRDRDHRGITNYRSNKCRYVRSSDHRALWVTLDAVLGATKPANVLQVGGNDGTNAYAIPLASGGASIVTSGTSTVTPSGIFEVSPTGAANTKTNPFFNQLADGTNSAVLGAFGTAPATSIYALAVESALVAMVSGTPTALTGTGTSLNVTAVSGSTAQR